jgi:hypothetical protein
MRAIELGRVAMAVARRPSLWLTACRQAWRVTPDDWWRRRPFAPVPAQTYLRFRTTTQYGRADHPLEPGDVVRYLTWCRQMAVIGR